MIINSKRTLRQTFKNNYSCKTDVQRNLLNRIVINKVCVIFLLRNIEAIHYVIKLIIH